MDFRSEIRVTGSVIPMGATFKACLLPNSPPPLEWSALNPLYMAPGGAQSQEAVVLGVPGTNRSLPPTSLVVVRGSSNWATKGSSVAPQGQGPTARGGSPLGRPGNPRTNALKGEEDKPRCGATRAF